MQKWIYFSVLISWLLVSCTTPKTKDCTLVPISPYLFGQNLWLTDGAEGRPGYIEEHLWPKVKQSGVKIIRIGGNGYDQVLPGFDTLTMWVKAIKEIGAEPMMQVSKYESAEKAAQVVKYFNVDNDLRITYWAIGNEPYIIHHVPIDSISKYIKASSTAMKAVDPTIKIFAPDEAAYDSKLYKALLTDSRTSVAGRDKNGNWYIDGVTFHNYPNAKQYTRSDVLFHSVDKMRGMILNLLDDIAVSNEIHQRFGDDRLIWGLTEFNVTYDNPDDLSASGIAVPSFINGQLWAEVFGMCMEYGAFCMTPWCIQESDRASTYFGYVGAPPTFTPHSTFYHMQLMAESMSGGYIKVTSSHPYLRAHGSTNENGSALLVMNQSEHESIPFKLGSRDSNTTANGVALVAQSAMRANLSSSIPANTTRIYTFDKKGSLLKTMEYSLDMAIKELAPVEIN
jgi:hypothetical protein